MVSWLLLVVLLFVFGLLLLALEVWILPGFGAVGILGAAALLAAAAIAWFKLGLVQGLIALGASIGTLALLAWWLPKSRTAQAMVLQPVLAGTGVETPAAAQPGAEGVTITALRPAGLVEFAGQQVHVVSDGTFIEAGIRVRVTHVEGARVVVEQAPDYQGATA